METNYYLVECMLGSEKECDEEMIRILTIQGDNANPMYVTCNRFD